MMLTKFLSASFIFVWLFSSGQNLVPNGDFETYTQCPNFPGAIFKAVPWQNPAAEGTPDYFNECATPPWGVSKYGVPKNIGGCQYAYSGMGYAGFASRAIRDSADFREYIMVQLTNPLVPGNCYEFELYWSLGEVSYYQLSELGVYFSCVSLSYPTYSQGALPLVPQVENITANKPDTAIWKKVNGTFTALGGEQYIIIGNFGSELDTTVFNPDADRNILTYVYIDNVSLRLCGSTGLLPHSQNSADYLSPTLFVEKLRVFSQAENQFHLYITNLQGVVVFESEVVAEEEIDGSRFDPGIYIYSLQSFSGEVSHGRIIKE